ncbi:chromosome segregation ATPase [Paenibacillus lactis]|uniref:Chromosome segregation ATPase n=1 Tax=Paenibacillus lactis TaxID=228574 RepID=A0ABS4F4X8_9BACL|nr:chromosome segregation ATPase [Paenibacillus lactis]MCM3493758.1 aspartyl-phosphate phosphatase Spo0E family protein [Paenibacillus lactis]
MMVSIENELKHVSDELEYLRRELERMAGSLEFVHQDVVALSQSFDKLIVRYMELKSHEEEINRKCAKLNKPSHE